LITGLKPGATVPGDVETGACYRCTEVLPAQKLEQFAFVWGGHSCPLFLGLIVQTFFGEGNRNQR
jgi:hypothetical protein